MMITVNDIVKGSTRSVDDFDIFEVIRQREEKLL